MATKTATKKKSTASRKKAAPVASAKLIHSVEGAKRLGADKQAKRFGILYVIFACATLVLACVSVKLYLVASEIESKYEEIEICTRMGGNCEVRRKVEEPEAVVEEVVTEVAE